MPKIYVSNSHKSGLGVYQSDDGELTFLVEVRKRPQSSMLTFLCDGNDKHRNHYSAENAWDELTEFLGGDLQIIPQKYLIKEFPQLKEEFNKRKEERALKRELKKGNL